MRIYTIGFTQKSAEEFFTLLRKNDIKTVIDVRLNNSSQLAGFAKGRDLRYFLNEILNITYIEDGVFAPTKEILDNYKKNKINWDQYEIDYKELLESRGIQEYINKKYCNKVNNICLLCSEVKPEKCHRRLAAEIIKEILFNEDIEIIHL